MSEPVYVNLVVEDELSERVLRHLLRESGRPYQVGLCYGRAGFGYIRRNIAAFNHAAKGTPYIVLADLDKTECAPLKMGEWLAAPRHTNLLFRVAVREVEAWLLADRISLAHFLRIQIDLIPQEFDRAPDPKAALIALARKSRRGELRRDLVPKPGSTSTQGPNYNARLADFVDNYWDASVAAQHSLSLAKAVRAIAAFAPTVSPTE